MPETEIDLPSFENLAEVESFEARVFAGATKEEQQLANFVLALALVYNDFKTLYWALFHLHQARGTRAPIRTRSWGQFFGFDNFIFRQFTVLVTELLNLLENYQPIIESHDFQEILRKLSKESREDWDRLLNPESDVRKVYNNVRSKIAAHYVLRDREGQKVLADGFRSFFINPDGSQKATPYLSRGGNLDESRFYFADAAAAQMVEDLRKDLKGDELKLLRSIAFPLMEIVLHFIYRKGGGLTKEKEPLAP